MPIVSIDVRDGDPTVQASGQHRGTVDATFDDGRVVSRNFRAPDLDAWNDLVAAAQATIQAQQEVQDAEDGVGPDTEVTAHKEASIEQRAVAYLRRAWQEENCRDAYLLFDKFNDYRLAKGWNLNQVQAGLASAGLGVEEWEEMKTAYTYLNGAGRPAIMNDYQTIQGNWEAR